MFRNPNLNKNFKLFNHISLFWLMQTSSLTRRISSAREYLSKKRMYYKLKLNYEPITRIMAKTEVGQDHFLPYTSKFSPYRHLFMITAGSSGNFTFYNYNSTLNKNVDLVNLESFQIAYQPIIDFVYTDKPNVPCFGSADGSIIFFNLDNDINKCSIIATYHPYEQSLTSMCMLSTCVVSASRDGHMKGIDPRLENAECCYDINTKLQVITSVVSIDSYYLICSGQKSEIFIYDVRNPKK